MDLLLTADSKVMQWYHHFREMATFGRTGNGMAGVSKILKVTQVSHPVSSLLILSFPSLPFASVTRSSCASR
jgi:hypothetical protein